MRYSIEEFLLVRAALLTCPVPEGVDQSPVMFSMQHREVKKEARLRKNRARKNRMRAVKRAAAQEAETATPDGESAKKEPRKADGAPPEQGETEKKTASNRKGRKNRRGQNAKAVQVAATKPTIVTTAVLHGPEKDGAENDTTQTDGVKAVEENMVLKDVTDVLDTETTTTAESTPIVSPMSSALMLDDEDEDVGLAKRVTAMDLTTMIQNAPWMRRKNGTDRNPTRDRVRRAVA